MMQKWLIRARLRRDAQVAALAPLLMPHDTSDRTLAGHRLIWALMPEDPEADRDFLWREEAPGRFMVLADRVPSTGSLFDVEARVFEPNLSQGDRLRFVLRANPTSSVVVPGQRGSRADVVMRALHGVSQEDRAGARPTLIHQAGAAWLVQRGTRHGFTPEEGTLKIDGYHRLRIVRTQDAAATEHRGMRARSGDVLPPHALVERDRRVDLAHHRARPLGEASAPHGVGAGLRSVGHRR